MKLYLIAMRSITYAIKAKELLNKLGLFCEIEKTPKDLASGCGYSIKVRDEPEKIKKLLKERGIGWREN
ncbi:MAG: DUF3343 domain-containing protein [Ruminococcus sp.]|nr:DUF3343 domain-containing protein [Ruminococcus sp.]